LVLGLLQPATLTFGFTLPATGELRKVALVVQIPMIRTKELLAMQALALGRTRNRRTQEFEPPLLQD
jgi:hypothetical protein